MKGICFTEPLFHKVAKGEKTQTRRMITPQPSGDFAGMINYTKSKLLKQRFDFSCGKSIDPKYMVGEIVYLKEPYAETCDEYGSPLIAYRFDNTALYLVRKDENGDYYQLNTIKKPVTTNWTINNFPACGEWKNKLFMPEWAARYLIEITAVRAERLQDISAGDCMKEGVISRVAAVYPYELIYQIPESPNYYATARQTYASLINNISGKGTWERNPFVWVYDFKLIQE